MGSEMCIRDSKDINKSHVDIIMLHVDINKSHVKIIMMHVDIDKSHVDEFMMHVDINKSHVHINKSHVDIIMLHVCRASCVIRLHLLKNYWTNLDQIWNAAYVV